MASKMSKSLEHLSSEERLKAGTVQPWKEAQGYFINVCRNLKTDCKALCSGGTQCQGKRHKLEHRRFHLSIRKQFCALWLTALAEVAQRWWSLLRDLPKSPGCGPGHSTLVSLLELRSDFTSNFSHSVVLWFCGVHEHFTADHESLTSLAQMDL